MRNNAKRLISLVMVLVMCLSLMPASAYSEEDIVTYESVEEAVAATSDWNYTYPQSENESDEDTCEHEWTDDEILEEPSCTEKGLAAHTCKVCGKSYMYDLPALGHIWDEGTKNINENNDEITIYKCKVCGEESTEIDSTVNYEWSNLSDDDFICWVRDSNHAVYIKNLLEVKNGEEYIAFSGRIETIADEQERNTVKEYIDSLEPAVQETTASQPLMMVPLTSAGNETSGQTITASGKDGNIEWSVDENGVLKVTCTDSVGGAIKDYAVGSTGSTTAPWGEYSDSVQSIVISGITSIGAYAFYGMKKAVTVSIPEGVLSIGSYAFAQCASIQSMNFATTVTSIGSNVLEGCTSLTSVSWPTALASLGTYVLSGCIGLTNITYPGYLTKIEEGTFSKCTGLTSIVIPDNITTIGAYAFNECTSLTAATIPITVTSIGNGVFSNCTDLVIYGTPGFTAETYAKNNSIPFVAIGDVPPELTDITVTQSATVVNTIVLKKSTSASGYEGTQFVISANPEKAIISSATVTSSDSNFIVSQDTTAAYDEHSLTYNLLYTGTEPGKAKVTVTVGSITKIIQVKTEDASSDPLPEAISIETNDELKLLYGSEYVMQYKVLPEGADQTVTVTSSNPDSVTISDDLKTINAVKKGKSTITVTSTTDTSVTGTYAVNVIVPATKIEISTEGNKEEVSLGKTLQFSATVTPDEAQSNDVIWTIDGNVDSSHATIDENGLLSVSETCTERSLTVRATTQGESGNISTTKAVSVKAIPTSVYIETSDTIYLAVNGTYTMNYAVLPSDASQSVDVVSSDSNVVSVDTSLKTLTANKVGTATITVTSKENTDIKGTYTVSVKEAVVPVTEVTISNKETEINAGTYCVLSASVKPDSATDKSVTWSITDANTTGVKIQKINGEYCLVVDKTCTKEKVTVRAQSVLTSSVYADKTFTIKPAPTSITIDTLSTIFMQVGNTHAMTYSVNPSNASQEVTVTSSNSDVAYVDGNNIVAKSIGTAVIKVASTVDETISSSYLVSVEVPAKSLTITAGRTEVVASDLVSIKLNLDPENATYYGVGWSVSSTTSGMSNYIRMIGSGSSYTMMTTKTCPATTFTLTATLKGTSNKVQGSITFTVKEKPTKITISPSETEMYTYDEYQLTPKFTPEDAYDVVTYSSSDTSVATVSDTGKITATGKSGDATITVTSSKDTTVSAKFKLTTKEGVSVFGYDNIQTVYAGKSLQMEISPNRKMGEKLTTKWTVSDTETAGITDGGILKTSSSCTPEVLTVYAEVTDEDGIKANGHTDVYVYNSLYLLNESGNVISSTIAIDMASKTTYKLTPEIEPLDDASDYVTWESSDTSIATVDDAGNVKFLSTGTVTIAATTNDGFDVSSSATFKITKSSSSSSSTSSKTSSTSSTASKTTAGAPTPSTITVNIDTLKTNNATAKLSPTNNNEINTEKDITVYEKDKESGKYENKSERFYVDKYDTKTDTIYIKAKKHVPDGKYTAQIQLECKDEKQYTINVIINVKNTEAPEITLAQSKFKIFYIDSTSIVSVKCEKEIEDVELVSDTFKGTYDDGKVTVSYQEPITETDEEMNKVVTLKIKLPGFVNAIEKSFELRTDDTRPSLVLNPSKEENNDSTEINTVLDGNSGDVEIYDEVNEEYMKAADVKNFPKWIARFKDGEENELIFDLVEILDDYANGGEAELEIQKSNWISPIKLTYNIKISNELPTLTPERDTMTLNRLLNAEEDEIKIICSMESLECKVKTELTDTPMGADIEEAEGWFDLSYEDGVLKLKFKDGCRDTAKAGIYTYTVTPTAVRKHKETELEPFTVNVAVRDSEPKLKLSKRILKENAKFGDGDATEVTLDYYSKSMGELTMTECEISKDLIVSYDKETGKLGVRKSESQNAGQHLMYFGKASFKLGENDLGSVWFVVIEVSFIPKVTISTVSIDKETTDHGTSTVEISDDGYTVVGFDGLDSDENLNITFDKEKKTLDVYLTDTAKAKDAQTFKVELTPIILSEATNHTGKGNSVTLKVHMEGFF